MKLTTLPLILLASSNQLSITPTHSYGPVPSSKTASEYAPPRTPVPSADQPRVRPQEPPGRTDLTTGGLVWARTVDNIAPQVALGDRGGQVLVWEPSRALVLLSSFDTNPPAPIWTAAPEDASSLFAAATDADVYLNCDARYRGYESAGVLKKFVSRSPVPCWGFAFPAQAFPQPAFDLSRNGETIVSAFALELGSTLVRVHDPATGAALQTWSFPDSWSRVDVSPDGTVAVVGDFVGYGSLAVLDVASGAVLFTHAGAPARRQALSADGRVLALFDETGPTSNYLRVFSRDAAGYQPVLEFPTPSYGFEWWDVALSEDGSTVVLASYDPNATNARANLRAFDVATGAMTMQRSQPIADWWNFPPSVAISADGSRFVYGFGGNNTAAVAELALYRRDSSEPLAEHGEAGPVYKVEMSSDGKRYVASRVQPTPPGQGNRSTVELYEIGGEDFAVRGRPSVGATVTFELHGVAGAHAVLLRSLALAPNPIDVPGVGRLRLDPASLTETSMGSVPPSGPATLAVAVDTAPGMVGRTLFYQGLTLAPRSLTRDWVQLTVVP